MVKYDINAVAYAFGKNVKSISIQFSQYGKNILSFFKWKRRIAYVVLSAKEKLGLVKRCLNGWCLKKRGFEVILLKGEWRMKEGCHDGTQWYQPMSKKTRPRSRTLPVIAGRLDQLRASSTLWACSSTKHSCMPCNELDLHMRYSLTLLYTPLSRYAAKTGHFTFFSISASNLEKSSLLAYTIAYCGICIHIRSHIHIHKYLLTYSHTCHVCMCFCVCFCGKCFLIISTGIGCPP